MGSHLLLYFSLICLLPIFCCDVCSVQISRELSNSEQMWNRLAVLHSLAISFIYRGSKKTCTDFYQLAFQGLCNVLESHCSHKKWHLFGNKTMSLSMPPRGMEWDSSIKVRDKPWKVTIPPDPLRKVSCRRCNGGVTWHSALPSYLKILSVSAAQCCPCIGKKTAFFFLAVRWLMNAREVSAWLPEWQANGWREKLSSGSLRFFP